jgi:small-conductance mechanosensitive channel
MQGHKNLLLVIFVCLGLFLFGTSMAGLAGAQDSATAVPESTPSPTPAAGTDRSLSDTVSETVSSISWQDFIEVAISMAVIFLVAFYGGKLLYVLLQRVANRTKYTLDNQLLEVIRPQISSFLLALGFQFATARLEFLDDNLEQLLQTSYFLLYLCVALATVWRADDFLVDWYITGNSEKMNKNLVTQVVPLLKRLAHITLILITGVIVAGYFGTDVLALSAALGLSGFALALAAKDTITNVISGFVLMVSQPFKVGDRIDVASLGSWGEVVAIGIRSTNVLMRDNRLVIVPNSAIVGNTVVNSYADKRRSTHDVNTTIQQLSEQLPIDMPNPTFTLDNKISLGDNELESVSRALNASKSAL